jgi:integrase
MAIYDRWHKTESGRKVKSPEYGCTARWQVRWRDQAGRQRKKAFATQAQATQFDAKVKTQLADGSYVDPAAGQVTFRSFAEDWRKHRDHDATTAARVEANLRNHAYSDDARGGRTPCGGPSIGDYPLRVLAQRPSILQAWIAGMPLGANTRLLVIGYVSQVFKAAVADRIITANPLKADSIQRPAPVRTEAIPWTAAQVAAVAARMQPPRLAALPYLGAACGLRQGELFGLAAGELDFLRRTLHVDTQLKLVDGAWVFGPLKNWKTTKSRDIPIDEPVLSIMAEHVRQFPPVAVTLPWGKPDGRPVTRELMFTVDGHQVERNIANWWWQKAWKAAGIPERGPRLNGMHVLRHTAASAWLSAGMNIAKVAALLGDTKEVVLKTYAHFMPEDDDHARSVMRTFFGALEAAENTASASDVTRAAR